MFSFSFGRFHKKPGSTPLEPILLAWYALFSCISWLLPNHYPPWTSFHNEAMHAIASVPLLVWGALHATTRQRAPRLTIVLAAIGLVPIFQFATGLVLFAGDVVVATAYLTTAALAIIAGDSLRAQFREIAARSIFCSLLFAALLSCGVALYQWLGLQGLSWLAVDLPPNGRPYGNLAQPNHLATLCCMAVAAAWYLYESRSVRGYVAYTSVVLLAFIVVLTRSRTGLIEMIAVAAIALFFRHRARLRISRMTVFSLLGFLVLFSLLLDPLSQLLLLPTETTLDQRLSTGRRPLMWTMLLDALSSRPLFGYGWGQIASAQASVALAYPALHVVTDYSHNFFLDFLLWNGVVLGCLALAALFWGFAPLIQRLGADSRSVSIGACLLAIGVHSMLEFPFAYMFFLIPTCLMVGLLSSDSPQARGTNRPATRALPLTLAIIATPLLAIIAHDYMHIEEEFRLLRFRSAGYGKYKPDQNISGVIALTNLREMIALGITPARSGMTDGEITLIEHVAARYPAQPVLFRLAEVYHLNDRPSDASRTLHTLCKLHRPSTCAQTEAAWKQRLSTGEARGHGPD